MKFVWKISELKGDDKAIFQAKYHLALIEDDLRIETEGYWEAIEAVLLLSNGCIANRCFFNSRYVSYKYNDLVSKLLYDER